MKTIHYIKFSLLWLLIVLPAVSRLLAQPQIKYIPFIKNLTKPINIKNAGDSSGRLFIVEQNGLIKIYKNGQLRPRPFLDIRNITGIGVYLGLWSIAFPPNYVSNRFFYVYYNDKQKNTIVARYTTSVVNPDSALPNSGIILFSMPKSKLNGGYFGEMHFGPDNNLYISLNDGSYYNKNFDDAQDGSVLYGKMLRLDVRTNQPPYFKIPPDNPFINDADIRDEIWAMGARNFWRWSFDRVNGNMWIGENGAERRDEIDSGEEVNLVEQILAGLVTNLLILLIPPIANP